MLPLISWEQVAGQGPPPTPFRETIWRYKKEKCLVWGPTGGVLTLEHWGPGVSGKKPQEWLLANIGKGEFIGRQWGQLTVGRDGWRTMPGKVRVRLVSFQGWDISSVKSTCPHRDAWAPNLVFFLPTTQDSNFWESQRLIGWVLAVDSPDWLREGTPWLIVLFRLHSKLLPKGNQGSVT